MSDTDQEFEGRVRDRAYHLWEAAGSPVGNPDEFWHRAREIEEGLRQGGSAGRSGEAARTGGNQQETAVESVADDLTEIRLPGHRGVT